MRSSFKLGNLTIGDIKLKNIVITSSAPATAYIAFLRNKKLSTLRNLTVEGPVYFQLEIGHIETPQLTLENFSFVDERDASEIVAFIDKVLSVAEELAREFKISYFTEEEMVKQLFEHFAQLIQQKQFEKLSQDIEKLINGWQNHIATKNGSTNTEPAII